MQTDFKTALTRLRTLFSPPAPTAAGAEILKHAETIEAPESRALWIEDLLLWLKKDAGTPGRYVRFKFLFQLLEKHPGSRDALLTQLSRLIAERPMLKLFLQTGFSDQQGLLQEAGRRLLSRVVPSVRRNDVHEIAEHVFKDEEDVAWLAALPPDLIDQLAALFRNEAGREMKNLLGEAARETLLVFASRVADIGLGAEIRERSHALLPSKSCFLQLQSEILGFVEAGPGANVPEPIARLLDECRARIADVHDDMEKNGASVALVYKLEVLSAVLGRIELLIAILDPAEANFARRVHRLLAESVEAVSRNRSIVGHVHQQTHLISRKIAERNGDSGDHYIARSAREYRTLFVSGLKGGAIVVFMTMLKLPLHEVHTPPLVEAFGIWIIYSLGFLSMQFTGSTLATKLPSFTASKLARAMGSVKESADLDLLVKDVRSVVRSQTVALIGNIVGLVPVAIVVHSLFELTPRGGFLSPEAGAKILSELHPLLSLAIPLGALTGVLLWLSSLAGGWFENWIVFRRVPRALSEHRDLRRLFGPRATGRLAAWLEHHASGISANVVLGFLFGFVPFFGVVTGIPMDAKHVTISSSSAVFGTLAVWADFDGLQAGLPVVIGLLLIGMANLAVSFALALVVAARATAVDPRRFRILLKLIGRRLIGL